MMEKITMNVGKLPQATATAVKKLLNLLNMTASETEGVEIDFMRGGKEQIVRFDGKTLYIQGSLGRGLRLFKDMGGTPFENRSTPKFEELGFTFDVSRNKIYNAQTVEDLLLRLSLLGYTKAYFMMEDCMEIDGEPYYGYMRFRYKGEELRAYDELAKSLGIELIPQIPTLSGFFKLVRKFHYWWRYFDCDDFLRAEDPLVLEFIGKLIAFCRKNFTSDKIHVSLDDTGGYLGRWWYHYHFGYKSTDAIVVDHVKNLIGLLEQNGYRKENMEMYSDLLIDSCTPMDMLQTYYDKNYTEEREYEPLWCDSFYVAGTRRKKYRPTALTAYVKDNFDSAPVLTCECVAEDTEEELERVFGLHTALKNRLSYALPVKCGNFVPHNGYYIQKLKTTVAVCEKYGVQSYTLSLFNDRGGECSAYAHAPTLARLSSLNYGDTDPTLAVFGVSAESFSYLDLPDKVEGEYARLVSPSEYGLYNDAFLGIYDKALQEKSATAFGGIADILLSTSKTAGEFSYLFKTEAELCKILEKKYPLGILTRKAYKSGDKAALKTLVKTHYKPLLKLVKTFEKSYRALWERENLSYGYEVQSLHLGGLHERLKTQIERIEKFVRTGEPISELTEDLLNPTCGDYPDGTPVWESDWCRIMSASRQ